MSETRTGDSEPTEPDSETDSEPDDDGDERVDDHLDGVGAGCGCAEVWEALSEQREE